MANNCYGKSFTGGGGDTGCQEVQLDSGAYLAEFWGYPSSEQSQFANDGVCESLATQLYDATCEPDTGFSNSPIAHVRDSQIVQKRRIPPLGPRATMRSATGEKGICDSDKQLTLHSLSIGIGAVAGLYLIPNKFLGAIGGMVAGGVVGGLILNSTCK